MYLKDENKYEQLQVDIFYVLFVWVLCNVCALKTVAVNAWSFPFSVISAKTEFHEHSIQ